MKIIMPIARLAIVSVAHELGEPIGGSGRVLAFGLSLIKPQARARNAIHQSLHYLGALVDQILLYE